MSTLQQLQTIHFFVCLCDMDFSIAVTETVIDVVIEA
jgi:hypothetical protein